MVKTARLTKNRCRGDGWRVTLHLTLISAFPERVVELSGLFSSWSFRTELKWEWWYSEKNSMCCYMPCWFRMRITDVILGSDQCNCHSTTWSQTSERLDCAQVKRGKGEHSPLWHNSSTIKAFSRSSQLSLEPLITLKQKSPIHISTSPRANKECYFTRF